MSSNSRRLREVMHPPHSIESTESVLVAVEKLEVTHVPAISVTDKGKVVGLLSNRDLLSAIIAQSLPLDKTKVYEVMNSEPVRISDDRDIASALLAMEVRGVREVLVQDFTGRVVGIFCNCGCCHLARTDTRGNS